MTIDILTELIPIPCTEHEKLNKLRSLLIEIQAAWFGNSFGSGETFSTPEIWEKMLEAVCLMHRSDDPSKKGIDLKAIASNYPLLEQIFIARHWETSGYVLDDSSFVGCDLIQMHRFSALGILKKVDALHQSILMQQSKENSDRTVEGRVIDSYQSEIIVGNDGRSIEQRVVDSYSDDAIADPKTQIIDEDGDSPN
jgi:hypothetical protein